MNKDTKNLSVLLFLLFFLVEILLHSTEIKLTMLQATEIWLTKVFPSLYPMFILSDLLSNYHFPEYMAMILGKPFQKIFHGSSYGIYAIIFSLLAGTPSSAIVLKKMVEEKKITKEMGNHLLKFTFFANPLFLITILQSLFPTSYVISIIASHYVANLIIAFLLRGKSPNQNEEIQKNKPQKLGTILSKSIKTNLNTLLMILGTLCFYFTIKTLLKTDIPLIDTLLSGFLELTQGLLSLANLESLLIKGLLAVMFLSFGGLSIHTQVKSILEESSLSYRAFLSGRILQTIISAFLFILQRASIAFIS